MEIHAIGAGLGGVSVLGALSFLFWRHVWFFRSPLRIPPEGDNILSPADGTVVYVKTVEPHEEVIVVKKGLSASVNDIVKEDLGARKILIGVFMSPFNVHFNRAPVGARVESIKHHPPRWKNVNMGPMHFRTLFRLPPYYRNSRHLLCNERTVTRFAGRFNGQDLHYYVVQIAGRSVRGIVSYVKEGDEVDKGALFGMIRIGSQVDLIVPWIEGMQVRVRPGDKVLGGETVVIE